MNDCCISSSMSLGRIRSREVGAVMCVTCKGNWGRSGLGPRLRNIPGSASWTQPETSDEMLGRQRLRGEGPDLGEGPVVGLDSTAYWWQGASGSGLGLSTTIR